MTITGYIQGWKTNSRCSGKGDVTPFFFFKADISTLFGLKNEKKKTEKKQKNKKQEQKQKQNEVVSCLSLFVKLYSKLYKFHFYQKVCVWKVARPKSFYDSLSP